MLNSRETNSASDGCEAISAASAPAPALLPVTRSLIAADALRQQIARAYRIGEPQTCQLLCSGSSDTYLLSTGNAPYVARVYRAGWRSLEEIEYELALLVHLAGEGISVPVPVANKNDALMHALPAPEGVRYVALFEYIEGTPVSFQNAEHAQLAGETAARIHAAADRFKRPCTRPRLDLAALIDEPLKALCPFLVSRPDARDYLEGLAARLRQKAQTAFTPDLDWGLCHGDFGHKNLLVTASTGLTVLDFDHCALGWRAYDFTSVWGDATRQQRMDIWDSFQRGYAQVRPLSEENVAAVPLFRALRHLFMLGMFAQNANDWGTLAIRGKNLDGWLTYLRELETGHLERREK